MIYVSRISFTAFSNGLVGSTFESALNTNDGVIIGSVLRRVPCWAGRISELPRFLLVIGACTGTNLYILTTCGLSHALYTHFHDSLQRNTFNITNTVQKLTPDILMFLLFAPFSLFLNCFGFHSSSGPRFRHPWLLPGRGCDVIPSAAGRKGHDETDAARHESNRAQRMHQGVPQEGEVFRTVLFWPINAWHRISCVCTCMSGAQPRMLHQKC